MFTDDFSFLICYFTWGKIIMMNRQKCGTLLCNRVPHFQRSISSRTDTAVFCSFEYMSDSCQWEPLAKQRRVSIAFIFSRLIYGTLQFSLIENF